MGDFVIESNNHCFFCLDKICKIPSNESKLSMVSSLQYLSRFLRMDMRKVFIEKGDIPSSLLSKVEMSRLKAHLCVECAPMNDAFSKLCHRLEKIELEVLSSLELIQRKLLKVEGLSRGPTSKLKKLVDIRDKLEHDLIGKLGILEVLRKEAIHKCSLKLKNVRPKIKVKNLSERDIHKYILRSRSSRSFTRQKSTTVRTSSNREQISPLTSTAGTLQTVFQKGGEHPPEISENGIKVKTEMEAIDHDQWPDDNEADLLVDFDIQTASPQYPNEPEVTNVKREPREPSHPFHLKVRKFCCTQCSKSFRRGYALRTHMLVHQGIKSFKCHLCTKGFIQAVHLRRHLLVHSGTRPCKCDLCDKRFFQTGDLNRHRRIVHARHDRHDST